MNATDTVDISSLRHSFEHVVDPSAIDAYGHVNNLVYMQWVLEAATRHSAAAGWDEARYLRENGAWIIRRHEIDYLRQAREGDVLVIETWVESYTRITAQRVCEIRERTGECICRCKTTWVYVARDTLRPARIPERLRLDFGAR
ncbi:MAG: acyl-CoA thioesterase [Polyangiales bacterium]